MLPQFVGMLKVMLNNLLCTSNIQGRELCGHDFMKCTFTTVMCQDTCERIYFKLGMMPSTAKLLCDSISNELDVHLRSQGYGQARTCAVILLSSCMKQLRCS